MNMPDENIRFSVNKPPRVTTHRMVLTRAQVEAAVRYYIDECQGVAVPEGGFSVSCLIDGKTGAEALCCFVEVAEND